MSKGRKVIQMNGQLKELAIYSSCFIAGETTGIEPASIRAACNREMKGSLRFRAGDYVWAWADDDAEVTESGRLTYE